MQLFNNIGYTEEHCWILHPELLPKKCADEKLMMVQVTLDKEMQEQLTEIEGLGDEDVKLSNRWLVLQ